MKRITALLIFVLGICHIVPGQNAAPSRVVGWLNDIDILVSRVENFHPMPWARITREEFTNRAEEIRQHINYWNDDKVTVEVMKLVALVGDGHTMVLPDNRESFNKWFPLRLEKFSDGLFVTAVAKDRKELLRGKVVKMGKYDSEEACNLVGELISTDSPDIVTRTLTDYLSNAVLLKQSGIIDSVDKLPLEIRCENGQIIKVDLNSSEWQLSFNWAYNKKAIPSNTEAITVLDDTTTTLPLYLKGFLESKGPFWFKYLPDDSLIFFQVNQVFDSNSETLLDYTIKVLDFYDSHLPLINKFIIDLRFNEGGNGDIVPSLVEQFRKRNNTLDRGKLFIVVSNNTFSAASIFIGQMKKTTNAITIGDIAGPLNFSSDPVLFNLPHNKILFNVSRLYSQDGHPTDKRGYYPPDYYIPVRATDYFQHHDPVMDAIKNDKIKTLKDIILSDGINAMKVEINRQREINGPWENWFPYTSYDMALFVYNQLIPSGKYEESLYLSELNTMIYPRSIWGWFLLGMIYENIGSLQDAYNCFGQVLDIEPCHAESEWEYSKIGALLYPVEVEEEILKNYTGDFEGRQITLVNGHLEYQETGAKKLMLIPVNAYIFLLGETGRMVEFEKSNGPAMKMKIVKWDGKMWIFRRN